MKSQENRKVLFECEGRPVYAGDRLFVASHYHQRCGAEVEAYREVNGESAVFRAIPSGAVPTLPITAVSWTPDPDTVDFETMQSQGIFHATRAHLNVWRLGRDAGKLVKR